MGIWRRTMSVAAVVTVAPIVFGLGTASAADPLIGKTFKEAAATIAGPMKAEAVVASTFGDELQQDACIVTSWSRKITRDASGHTGPKSILVNLSCISPVATGKPGNSAASPVGKAAKAIAVKAEYMNTHPEYCQQKEKITYCIGFCKKYAGMCTFDPE